MHVEAASGIVLLVAAVIALGWANSPWAESYEHLWHTRLAIGLGSWSFEESLHFWINDFLMAVFFYVVGLEIKREIFEGALSDMRQAALPIAAAIGGMAIPALLFAGITIGGPAHHGWGVPMATDTAFAVGILTLLGKRVPSALRVLLLAIAIIDDIGAILVIAIFYSNGFHPQALLLAAGGILGIQILNWVGVRPGLVWAIPPLLVWIGMLQLGVHPTIAGVIVGLMTPIKPWFGRTQFLEVARGALDDFQQRTQDGADDHDLLEPLQLLALARREALGPAKRIESRLHPIVAFLIMPLFALANAGVPLSGLQFDVTGLPAAMVGVVVGLAIGKPLGILGASWISVRAGLCRLPPGVNWRGIAVLGMAGGIGFTMAIFIAQLAYAGGPYIGAAKLAVLIGTGLAGAGALLGGVFLLPSEQPADVSEISMSDLEASVEYWAAPTDKPSPPRSPRDGFQIRM